VIWGKTGFFEVIFRGNIGFWGKNGGWLVKLWGLGKIGKKKALKNVQKRLKIFENVQKYSKSCVKYCKKVRFFALFCTFSLPRRHVRPSQ